MFLMCFLNLTTSSDNKNPGKGCLGFGRYVVDVHCIVLLDLLVKTVFACYNLKLSLPMFLNFCLIIFPI